MLKKTVFIAHFKMHLGVKVLHFAPHMK